MAQLMPLPLTVSCFSKIQIGFTFLVLAFPGVPGLRAVKWVSVCENNVVANSKAWTVLTHDNSIIVALQMCSKQERSQNKTN